MTDLPTDGQPIEAVPTEYGGTTFRSRLEADWARTLDTQSILRARACMARPLAGEGPPRPDRLGAVR